MKKGFLCVVTLLLTMMFAGFSNKSIFTETVYAAAEDEFDDEEYEEIDDTDDFDDDEFEYCDDADDDEFEDYDDSEDYDDADNDEFEDYDSFEDYDNSGENYDYNDYDEFDDENIELPTIGTKIYDKASKAWYKVIEIDDETETALLEYVKSNNASAATIVIPEEVETDDDIYEVIKVANNAFLNNKAVKKVVISDGVLTIGSKAFKGCSKLTTVTMGRDVQVIGTSAFEDCSKLKTLTLREGVLTIGDKAFKKCVSLSKVIIPKSVSKIGKKAFCGDKQLKNITIKSTKYTAKSFGKQVFKDIHKNAVIKVPAKKSASYKRILKGAGFSGKSQKVK